MLVSNAFTVDVQPAGSVTLDSWNRQIAVNLTARLARRSSVPAGPAASARTAAAPSSWSPRCTPSWACPATRLRRGQRRAVRAGPPARRRVRPAAAGQQRAARAVLTAAWDRVPEADRDRSAAATALGAFGRPDEVAAAIAFLASADASYVTGASWSSTAAGAS